MTTICAQCKDYIGGGDWGLCCKHTYGLVDEDTQVADCPHFEQMEECVNRSSRVGVFRCSICGKAFRESKVGESCPGCGSEITGGLWNGQKHYRGGE